MGRAGHGSSGDAIQLICYKNAVYTVFVYTGVVECCTLNADVGLWVWPACVTYTGRAMVFHPFVTFGNVYCQQPSSLTWVVGGLTMAKVDGLLLYLTLCCLYQFVVYVSANIHPKGGKVNAGQDDGSYKLTILQLVVYTVSMLSAERLHSSQFLVSFYQSARGGTDFHWQRGKGYNFLCSVARHNK